MNWNAMGWAFGGVVLLAISGAGACATSTPASYDDDGDEQETSSPADASGNAKPVSSSNPPLIGNLDSGGSSSSDIDADTGDEDADSPVVDSGSSRDASSPVDASVVDSGSSKDAGRDSGGPRDAGAPRDGGGSCGSTPKLHPATKPGVYCPYSGASASLNITCAANEHCCETPKGTSPSTCEADSVSCPVANSTDWDCLGSIDCTDPSKPVCCGRGTVELDSNCGFNRGKGDFNGAHCASSCSPSEVIICASVTECSSGKCTPFSTKGLQLGSCE